MADVLYVITTVTFFALAAGFVRLCDRIIGPDPTPTEDMAEAAQPTEVVDTDPVTAGAAK
jgi:hypothetical protein